MSKFLDYEGLQTYHGNLINRIDSALDNKADKSTTYTKTEVDTALANKADITDIPTVPITAIQKNGTGITPVSGTVNITVPTTAADVSALPDITKYATALSLTINSSTFVMTGQLKDQNGDNLGTAQTIDLPLESVVVGGSYNSQTKKVVLTLQNGNTIEFSVADLVSGLQTEITSANKLDADLVDDSTSTNKFVTSTEKSTWNDKQDALNSAQLNAVDSGVTSEDVSQIETNKNNISSILDGTNIDSFGDVETALATKVDKETGKGLSTNDYTTAEKTKLDDLANIQSIGDGLSLDNGELSAIVSELVKTKIVNSINTASPSSSAPKGIILNMWSIDTANEMLILNKVAFENSIKETGVYSPDTWNVKTWSGLTSFNGGEGIWTDGETVYYSFGSDQYVLDKTNSTWIPKTWNGLTSFDGNRIWTDGENIYYSHYTTGNYVLNKSTSTWSVKTWTGLTNFDGNIVWTDGENVYCSAGSDQYVLDKSTSTWYAKTWKGYTSLHSRYIWTDGDEIYYSDYEAHYVLDKDTSTWNEKTWIGLTIFYGNNIWTDGENIYYSSGSAQYVLDKSTSTWSTKTWTGLTNFYSGGIWTDGDEIYYSNGSNQYVLK